MFSAGPSPATYELQGRGCDLHTGGVGAAGLGPEDAVPRRDSGDLQPPSLPGASAFQTGCELPAGARGRPMEGRAGTYSRLEGYT